MGNWFSSCTCGKTTDSACSFSQEKSRNQNNSLMTKKKGNKGKNRNLKNQCGKTKESRTDITQTVLQEKLSLTSIQSDEKLKAKSATISQVAPPASGFTVFGHAMPIRQKTTPLEIECKVSKSKNDVPQENVTTEHSSDETLPDRRLKRPITGSQSNVFLPSNGGVEELPNGQPKLLNNDEESESAESASASPTKATLERERSVPSSHFQLLDILKVRLDMAINNMEINRLMANVQRALDRSSRTRELGFQRIRAARTSRRVYPVEDDIRSETVVDEEEFEEVVDEEDDFADGEETGEDTITDGEELRSYDEDTDEDSCSNEESETPPPPPVKPKICWQ